MKPGASDPFADEEDEDDVPEDGAEPAVDAEAATDESDADAGNAADADAASDDEPADSTTDGAADAPLELPYIYRRDKVKDERPDVHQLFVRDETDTLARDAERDLEKLLGEDVYRLDAREAIYLAGMRHLDEAADVLREWGYDR